MSKILKGVTFPLHYLNEKKNIIKNYKMININKENFKEYNSNENFNFEEKISLSDNTQRNLLKIKEKENFGTNENPEEDFESLQNAIDCFIYPEGNEETISLTNSDKEKDLSDEENANKEKIKENPQKFSLNNESEENKKFIFLEDSFAIWEKPGNNNNKNKLKNFELNKHQKQKLLSLQRETENKLEEILNFKEEKNFTEKPEIIHSNFSTNPSSKCTTPESVSPEGNLNTNLFENNNNNFNEISYEEFKNKIITSGKNLFEKTPLDYSNINNKLFPQKIEDEDLNNFNFFNGNNNNCYLNFSKNLNIKSNEFNNNNKNVNHKYQQNQMTPQNNFYDNSSIYQNYKFPQNPFYNNNFYNNFNANFYNNFQEMQNYQQKIQKNSNDPFSVLRENNYLIKINGKNIPFEEPHNRINLENVNILFNF